MRIDHYQPGEVLRATERPSASAASSSFGRIARRRPAPTAATAPLSIQLHAAARAHNSRVIGDLAASAVRAIATCFRGLAAASAAAAPDPGRRDRAALARRERVAQPRHPPHRSPLHRARVRARWRRRPLARRAGGLPPPPLPKEQHMKLNDSPFAPNFAAIKQKQQATWASGDYAVDRHHAADRRRVARRGRRRARRRARPRRRRRQRQRDARRRAPLRRGRPRPTTSRAARQGPRAGRAPKACPCTSSKPTPRSCRSPTPRSTSCCRPSARCSRRITRAPRRDAARAASRRPHRAGQLDAGRLHRPPVQGDRRPRAAARRAEAARAVGHRAAPGRAVRRDSAAAIRCERRIFNFRYRSAAHWMQVFRDFYGPTHKAFAALDAAGQGALERDIIALLEPTQRRRRALAGRAVRVPRNRHHQTLKELPMNRITALAFAATSVVAAGCATPAFQPVPETLRPAGERLAMTVPARGVQIYECRARKDGGFEWAFVAPDAELFDTKTRPIGRHGAGPFWQASDGSRVVGTLKARADAPQPGRSPGCCSRRSRPVPRATSAVSPASSASTPPAASRRRRRVPRPCRAPRPACRTRPTTSSSPRTDPQPKTEGNTNAHLNEIEPGPRDRGGPHSPRRSRRRERRCRHRLERQGQRHRHRSEARHAAGDPRDGVRADGSSPRRHWRDDGRVARRRRRLRQSRGPVEAAARPAGFDRQGLRGRARRHSGQHGEGERRRRRRARGRGGLRAAREGHRGARGVPAARRPRCLRSNGRRGRADRGRRVPPG